MDTSLPLIFDTCKPKDDVRSGTMADAEFAADLSMVLRGNAPPEYLDPKLFFGNTYPTRGLKNLLLNVCSRLSRGAGVASIFRLDTSYGGGKTHGLIALIHACKSGNAVTDIEEFVDRENLPAGEVRIAAFDGENADPANGRLMEPGVRAFTPWGELAYQLGGREGYELVKPSDVGRMAPGADTLRELFAGKPTLILLDELSVYLRKIASLAGAREQLTAFLTSLFKAIESTPNAVLVYTLAVGKDGKAADAYGAENQFIAQQTAELESVSARKATILNPTEDDETVQVLKRRLFQSVDLDGAQSVVESYLSLWQSNRESLPANAVNPEVIERFRASYPLHPEVLATLTGKTATVANFQRVRGMLRLLARTIAELWKAQPQDATAIHLHHIDPGFEPIRQEFVTRLQQSLYTPTILNDISGEKGKTALAQEIDKTSYPGLPPFASYVARTIFIHSIAFPASLQGLTPDELRFSIVAPTLDIGFIEDARKRFQEKSAYLDDRPGAPLRFLTEANLTRIVERQIQLCDPGEVRARLNDRIKSTYAQGDHFELNYFPGTAGEVPDEVGGGKPLLVLLSYDSVSIGTAVEEVPELVARLHKHVGADERGFRKLLNNLVFVVADDGRVSDMRRSIAKALALEELVKPERCKDMAVHQQEKLREWQRKSGQEANQAIQHCYRHIFYPSPQGASSGSDLAHTAVEVTNTDQMEGQRAIVRALRDLGKLRSSIEQDKQDAPTRIRDRTPLRKGEISTLELRGEFRRNVDLPMLIGDVTFTRGIQEGVKRSEYIYKYRDMLLGPGDPETYITVAEDAFVYTMSYAKEHGIWPPAPPPSAAPVGGAGPTVTATPSGSAGVSPVSAEDPNPRLPLGSLVPVQASIGTFRHEGPLREALKVVLLEKARTSSAKKIASLNIRLTELLDASRLLSVAGGVSGAATHITFEGHYATETGGEFEFEFRGPIADALPVKDFLVPEFRNSTEKECIANFTFSFVDGLNLEGDAPDKLIEKLTQQAVGAAFVTATATAV